MPQLSSVCDDHATKTPFGTGLDTGTPHRKHGVNGVKHGEATFSHLLGTDFVGTKLRNLNPSVLNRLNLKNLVSVYVSMLLIKFRLQGYSTRMIHCLVNLGASLSNVFEAHPFPELNNLDVIVDVVSNQIIYRSLKRDLHDEFGKFHFGWQHCYPTRSGEVSHAAQRTTLGQDGTSSNRGLPQRGTLVLIQQLQLSTSSRKTQKIRTLTRAFSMDKTRLIEFDGFFEAKTHLIDSRMARIIQLVQKTWLLEIWT